MIKKIHLLRHSLRHDFVVYLSLVLHQHLVGRGRDIISRGREGAAREWGLAARGAWLPRFRDGGGATGGAAAAAFAAVAVEGFRPLGSDAAHSWRSSKGGSLGMAWRGSGASPPAELGSLSRRMRCSSRSPAELQPLPLPLRWWQRRGSVRWVQTPLVLGGAWKEYP